MAPVTCLRCGEPAKVSVDVTDGETFYCFSCDTEFTVAVVRELIASWQQILAWLDAHPAKGK